MDRGAQRATVHRVTKSWDMTEATARTHVPGYIFLKKCIAFSLVHVFHCNSGIGL